MRTINVTQEDIDQGRRGDNHGCAIARAVRREMGMLETALDKAIDERERERVTVPNAEKQYTKNHQYTTIKVDGKLYHLPKKGRDFMVKFDFDRATAEPFSFALREVK
jgi:hypothetical protein